MLSFEVQNKADKKYKRKLKNFIYFQIYFLCLKNEYLALWSFCLIRRNAVEINFFNVLAFKAKTKLKGYSEKVVIDGRNNFKSQKGF